MILPSPFICFIFARSLSIANETDFGSLTVLFGLIHGFAHIARTIAGGHEREFIEKCMDRSGLVALVPLIPIAFPMMLGSIKKLVRQFPHINSPLFVPWGNKN